MESCKENRNLLEDKALAAYYEKLRCMTRGPIFGRRRWADILELNFGSDRVYTKPYE